MELKQTRHVLVALFWGLTALSVAICAAYELEWLTETFVGEEPQTLFTLQVILELGTIICVPTALYLFKWSVIANKLKGNPQALRTWGCVRILLLCVPLLCDTILYEQTKTPSFGYLAVIVLLCLFFIYPSMDRCRADIAIEGTDEGK